MGEMEQKILQLGQQRHLEGPTPCYARQPTPGEAQGTADSCSPNRQPQVAVNPSLARGFYCNLLMHEKKNANKTPQLPQLQLDSFCFFLSP